MRYKTNTQEFIFLLLYVIYLISVILGYTVFEENDTCALIFKGLRYFCYLLAIIKIIRDGFYKNQIFEVIIVAALVILTVLFSQNKIFAFYFLIILAAKDINMRRILKVSCYVQGIVLAVIVGLSQFGILQDYIFDPNTRGRHGLGFTWTTTAPIMYFFFMMVYVYLRREQVHALELVILEIINYWLYLKTDARMCFFLSSLMLLYVFAMRYYWVNRYNAIKKNKVLVLAPAFMCCVGIALHLFYNSGSETWNRINDLLSGRLALGYAGMQTYGLSLFGTPIEWIGFDHNASAGTYNYVDCSYMQILLENGIVSLAVIVLIYTYIMYMAIKTKDFYLQTVILFIVVFSITEPRLMNLGFNAFPFFAISYWTINSREKLFGKEKCTLNGLRWRLLHVGMKKRC